MTPMTLDGRAVAAKAPAESPLLWVLRNELKLSGPKFGCGTARRCAVPAPRRWAASPHAFA